MKKPPRKKYYIQPEDLRAEITEYQTTGKASERLGGMLIQIATGLAASSKFDQRTYRDDMASDAVLRMYKNLALIDVTDPTDLPKCALRDFNTNAKLKFSKTPLNDEQRRNDKSLTGLKPCIIQEYIIGEDTCTVGFYKMMKKSYVSEDGTTEEISEMKITKVTPLVPLEHVLFKKTNPFSYLTMIAYRVYLGRCDKENKKARATDTYREQCYSEFESGECLSNRSPNEGDMDMGFDYYDQPDAKEIKK